MDSSEQFVPPHLKHPAPGGTDVPVPCLVRGEDRKIRSPLGWKSSILTAGFLDWFAKVTTTGKKRCNSHHTTSCLFFASISSPREGRRSRYTHLGTSRVLCSFLRAGSKVNTPRDSLNFSEQCFPGKIQALFIHIWAWEACRFLFLIENSRYVP